MKDRRYWNNTARGWNRKPGLVVVSLDPEHPEVTMRVPAGEMAGMNEREARELMNHIGEALGELRRRD